MQTQHSKERPSSIYMYLQGSVKKEGIFPTCSVKRENASTDNTCQLASSKFDFPLKRRMSDGEDEMTAPHKKHIKQENDDSSLWENKEGILLSSKTSLQNIVCEVAYSLENNNYEGIPLFDAKENSAGLDISNSRYLVDKKDTIVLEREGRQVQSLPQTVHVDAVTTGYENDEFFSPSTDGRKQARSGFPAGEQVQDETTKPILRTLKGLNSGVDEGFAFDHNFFPKLVGVHSILSPTSSTEAEPLANSQQTSPPPALEKVYQDQHTNDMLDKEEETADIYEVDATASSPSNEIILVNSQRQSPTNAQSQKQYDLLLTFTQEDGTSDMFLVIKEEVFAVKRFDYRGESYLIHTDSKGKTSILAKAPKEEGSNCQTGSISASAGQTVSFQRGKTTNISSFASGQSKHMSCQNNTMQNRREPQRINSTALQNDFDVNGRETVPRNANERQISYGRTQLPNMQLLNYASRTRAEPPGYMQRPPVAPERPPAGQQRPPSEAGAERHHVVTNGLRQSSTASCPFSAHSPSRTTTTSSNSWSNQHSIVNRDLATRNHLRSDGIIANSQDQYQNNGTQSAVGQARLGYLNTEAIDLNNYELLALAKRRSPTLTNEKRIERRSELLKYITDHLASNEKPVQPTTNPLDFTTPAIKRTETTSKSSDGALNKPLIKNRLINRCQEMAEFRQRLRNRVPLTQENTEGHLISNINMDSSLSSRYVDQRQHPNQPIMQNGSVYRLERRSSVTDSNVNPLQGSFQSYGAAEGNNKILEIIESCNRRQQTIASNSNCQVIRQLLTRNNQSVSSAQNIREVDHSQRETTVSKNTQVMRQPSTTTNVTPIISQVSYGVISRSTDGENVRPRKTATALVIDQQGFIYVDATDSVIDDGGRRGNTGQRFPNEGNTASGLHLNQTGNVAISPPVSSGAPGGSWLQEAGRQLSSETTSGQQLFFSSVSQRPATLSTSYPRSDQRLYTYTTLAEKTVPRIDKRCVGNNTLNPVNYPIQGSHPITETPVFSTGQQSYIGEALARAAANAAKPCAVTKGRVVDEPGEVFKPSVVAKSSVVAKPSVVVKPSVVAKAEPWDVIEIVDSPPSVDTTESNCNTTLESENKETEHMVVRDAQSSIEKLQNYVEQLPAVAKPCKAEQHETDDVVEIRNPSVEQDSTDHENGVKDNKSAKEEEATRIRNEALRDELIKKIQNTRERIEQEKIEWKKSRLNRLKAVLMKKLAKLPGGITVVVDDD